MRIENTVILESLGAAGTVTGSKHLLKTPDLILLVDCGLFQGLKSARQKNWDKLLIDPASVDILILTHAHLDHCGYLPLMIKNGFKGKVYMTAPTADLIALILMDSAKIQVEDAENANYSKYSKHQPALPLYNQNEVDVALRLIEIVDHSIVTKISPNISFQFKKNGHMLGSCSLEINCYDKQIIFSGDIGRYSSRFLMPPENLDGADYVIMESTYGDRLHPREDISDQLSKIINDTLLRHGNVLIPSFAVGRAQEIMHLLNELKLREKIPHDLPVYLDSPMAASATELFLKYPEWHRLTEIECSRMYKDVFINRDYHNTKKILASPGSKIIISSSGMLTGGRVLEYLKHYVINPNHTILLIGYQAEGTRGRALQNHAHEVRIHGNFFPVRAEVAEIPGLSGHADQNELIQWLRCFKKIPKRIFLVHGDPDALDAFRIKLKDEFNIDAQIQVEGKETILYNI